jgi:hypothetical protein
LPSSSSSPPWLWLLLRLARCGGGAVLAATELREASNLVIFFPSELLLLRFSLHEEGYLLGSSREKKHEKKQERE